MLASRTKHDGDSVWDEYPANVFPTEYPQFGELTVQGYQTLRGRGKITFARDCTLFKITGRLF
jgi:hypothetical protein